MDRVLKELLPILPREAVHRRRQIEVRGVSLRQLAKQLVHALGSGAAALGASQRSPAASGARRGQHALRVAAQRGAKERGFIARLQDFEFGSTSTTAIPSWVSQASFKPPLLMMCLRAMQICSTTVSSIR